MNKVKQFITARRISLGLILVVAALMYVSTIIPQEIDSTPAGIEAWRRAHGGLLWLIDAAHLHRMYAQPWFAAAILFAALALGVSSYDQVVVARKKLRSTGIAPGEVVAESIAEQQLRFAAHSHRYRFSRTGSGETLKFVRSPWGYFGIVLLHVGITLVIMVSFSVALTGRQGVLILTEGEERDNRQPWNASEEGLLASKLKLPGTVRLDKLSVRFDAKHQPSDVSSVISITDESGRVDSLTASINRISRYHGLRIYHGAQYGDAFSVVFTDKAGVQHAEKILIQQPVSLTDAGYSDDFSVAWSPYLFSAKYYADAAKQSMQSNNPQLVVRALDGKRERARTALTPGSSGQLGEYHVQLTRVEKWAKLIIVDITGMPLIFMGFAVIMLGGLMHYMTPPRELIAIRQDDGHYRVYWKALFFREFYAEERDSVMETLKKGAV